MDWTVEYYRDSSGREPVKDFINNLSKDARVKTLRIITLLRDKGVLLKEPYTRQVRGKIRELRIKDTTGNIRVLYFTFTGRRVILLHAFVKKSDKTPVEEINTAIRRMNDFISRGG